MVVVHRMKVLTRCSLLGIIIDTGGVKGQSYLGATYWFVPFIVFDKYSD
jgi:hypothetical protein